MNRNRLLLHAVIGKTDAINECEDEPQPQDEEVPDLVSLEARAEEEVPRRILVSSRKVFAGPRRVEVGTQ